MNSFKNVWMIKMIQVLNFAYKYIIISLDYQYNQQICGICIKSNIGTFIIGFCNLLKESSHGEKSGI